MTNKNGKISAPVGFVTFANRQDADEACRKLQGVRFDPDCAQTIRLEMARSTTKVVSKQKQPSPPIISPATLPPILPQTNSHAALAAAAASNPAFLLAAQQAADLQNISEQYHYLNEQSHLYGLTLPASPLILQSQLVNAMTQIQQQQQLNGLLNMAASVPSVITPMSTNPNPPCSTLFVANLGTNVDEDEVRQLFKAQPGFSR
jgi:hypothetical protein